MASVGVRCRTCGRLVVGRGVPEAGGALLEGAVVQCPACGTEDPYFTADLVPLLGIPRSRAAEWPLAARTRLHRWARRLPWSGRRSVDHG